MSNETKKDRSAATLRDEDISTGRRRVVRGIGLGVLGLGGTGLAACVPTTTGGITDADNGPIADPGGAGRGGLRSAPTGLTDANNGPIVDPGGYGRGGGPVIRTSGITDSDLGAYADPVGNGRGRRSCTDSDVVGYVDPVGQGRRC